MSMTLKQLAARLNAIVAENEAKGCADRNDMPAMIRLSPPVRKPRQHYKAPKFFTIDAAPSCLVGFWSENPVTGNKVKVHATTIETRESNAYNVVSGPAMTINQ